MMKVQKEVIFFINFQFDLQMIQLMLKLESIKHLTNIDHFAKH